MNVSPIGGNSNFNGKFCGMLSKLRSKISSVIPAKKPKTGDVFVMRERGVTVAHKVLPNGEALKAVVYPPEVWPHTDLVFTKSMCKKLDKNLVGLRMTIPDKYAMKHPEVLTPDGAVEFIQKMDELMDAVQNGLGKRKKQAEDELAKILEIEGPYKTYSGSV